MRYESARYFVVSFFSKATHQELCDYAEQNASIYARPMKIEGLAHLERLEIRKYRKREFGADKCSKFLANAARDDCRELGIYIASDDFSRECAPSYLCNVHLSFAGTVAGVRIKELPTGFVILGIRRDRDEFEAVRTHAITRRPESLAGGCWLNRAYEDHGASLEWAYNNYAQESLADWNPDFDQRYA